MQKVKKYRGDGTVTLHTRSVYHLHSRYHTAGISSVSEETDIIKYTAETGHLNSSCSDNTTRNCSLFWCFCKQGGCRSERVLRLRLTAQNKKVVSNDTTFWCGRRDLNPYVGNTRPSNVRVCRFRHSRRTLKIILHIFRFVKRFLRVFSLFFLFIFYSPQNRRIS